MEVSTVREEDPHTHEQDILCITILDAHNPRGGIIKITHIVLEHSGQVIVRNYNQIVLSATITTTTVN